MPERTSSADAEEFTGATSIAHPKPVCCVVPKRKANPSGVGVDADFGSAEKEFEDFEESTRTFSGEPGMAADIKTSSCAYAP
jgi:hypothetical protein